MLGGVKYKLNLHFRGRQGLRTTLDGDRKAAVPPTQRCQGLDSASKPRLALLPGSGCVGGRDSQNEARGARLRWKAATLSPCGGDPRPLLLGGSTSDKRTGFQTVLTIPEGQSLPILADRGRRPPAAGGFAKPLRPAPVARDCGWRGSLVDTFDIAGIAHERATTGSRKRTRWPSSLP